MLAAQTTIETIRTSGNYPVSVLPVDQLLFHPILIDFVFVVVWKVVVQYVSKKTCTVDGSVAALRKCYIGHD